MLLYSRALVLLLVLCYGLSCVSARQCLGRDQCSCAFDDDQSLIALHSLGNSDLTPRWQDMSFTDGYKYSYNPCYPFTEDNCANAAACKTNKAGDSQNIGDAQPVEFTFVNDQLKIGYSSGSEVLTETTVNLICDPHGCDPTLALEGRNGANSYVFTLTSVCACPNGCNETGPVNCIPAAAPPVHSATIVHIAIGVTVSYWLGYKR